MMEGKKSRTNSNTDFVVDRISALPNSILSSLPTNEAVATCVLSKRWKFAWVTVHNLDFCYHDPQVASSDSVENMAFIGFVQRVLLPIDAGPLNRFSLHWHAWTISSHVICWVDAAIKRNALGRATISLSTKFKRLVKLVAGTYCCSVQDFINNSENLEDLIIYEDYCTSDLHNHSRWTAPIEVPRCLSYSLKKVRFDGYKGLEDEREMIRYMLDHGIALEVMRIRCSSKKDGEKLELLLQEICEFPRKSPACKIQFSVWPTKREFQPLY